MNISRKDIDALNATLTVQVSKEDYQENVDKMLQDYRKKVNMPGFRPGKVPASLVKRMYGKAVMAEEINKILSEKLTSYIKENNIAVLGEPLPNEEEQKEIDFDNQETFEFVFDLGIAPKISVDTTKKTKIPYYNIAVTDEIVADQIKAYTNRFGNHVDADIVEESDVVRGEITSEDGLDVKDAILCPKYMKADDQKQLFVAKKVGDAIQFDVKKAYENNEAEIASLLKKKKEEVASINGNVTFTVTKITRYKEAEMNQDLFNKVFGEGVVTTEEEFKNKVKEGVVENLTSNSDYQFSVDAKKTLVDSLGDVQFPDAFLKRWALATNKELTEEKLDAEYGKMIEDLKWHLIQEEIVKANDIKVEFPDIEAFAKKVAQAQFAQYGMPNVPNDILDGYVKDMLKDESAVRNMMNGAVNDKVIAVIKSSVTLKESEVSLEDFHKKSQEALA